MRALEELPYRIQRVEDMQDVGLCGHLVRFYDIDAHLILSSDKGRRTGHKKTGRGVPVESTTAECGYSIVIFPEWFRQFYRHR